jgi:4-hydroxythreonine-4-phosphate dehydrogenase
VCWEELDLLIVTLGDPHSCNVELVAKTLPSFLESGPICLIGSLWHWRDQCHRLEIREFDLNLIESIDGVVGEGLYFLDVGQGSTACASTLSKNECGMIAARSLAILADFKFHKPFSVVTAPIDKSSVNKVGFSWPGQTEYFEAIWKTRAIMLLAGPTLKVGLVTNHLPISSVSIAISQDLIIEKLTILTRAMRDIYGIAVPKIAVSGLNPHCGDSGMFGDEELEIIQPAIEKFNRVVDHKICFGPISADGVFHQAQTGQYDAVLAMYHDQGLGPLKTVHFFDAINISAGLPNLRVSPDHGTARPLYMQGTANGESMFRAFQIAVDYLARDSQ